MLLLRNIFNLLKILVKLVAFRVLILRWPESHGRWSKLISWSLFYESQTFGNVIYTDGSEIQNRVGCAFVHFQENDEIFSEPFQLSDEATVFMAEVVAIRQGIKYIIGRQLKQAKIISDSRSALMSLASVHDRRVIINEIRNKIREYLGGHPVNLDTG
ncbi:hypothetical protein AVEN_69459-1 [Araneus ventricosus]|uniref:Uncharacterized protein n=1 Tax=Araneus ventricosus TaxID=182803 RepID=A0A4Y2VQA9_ARAVE|nr:hypothetical protein AVEN_69459-1 [Araneus ventricosus]